MLAQARAWKDDARTFDILGRYESRLTRQLVLYRKELAHLVDTRLSAAPALSAAAAASSMDTTLQAAQALSAVRHGHAAISRVLRPIRPTRS